MPKCGNMRGSCRKNSLNKILELARALLPEDRRRLLELLLLSAPTSQPAKTLEQIASEQGKKPPNFEEIRKLGSFFPEDESVDELVRTVRELRRDRSPRSLG
jgi:hypothetical protein